MSGGEPSHSRSRLSTFKIGAATTGEGLKLGPSNPDLGSTPFALSSSYPPIRSVGSPLSLSSRPGRTLEGISGFGSLPFSDPPRSDATTVYQDRMDDGGEVRKIPPTNCLLDHNQFCILLLCTDSSSFCDLISYRRLGQLYLQH